MENTEEQAGEGKADNTSRIPTSKVKRAARILGTGAKVGTNYIKYYAKKAVNPDLSKDTLHAENAEDIYASLSELKGSALKVAQMMSMDNAVLPKAYQDKFAMAQYNAPPLSYPLVLKTFQQHFGQKPLDLFDEFSREAVYAASIGQVHRARKGDLELAVKIQYPGVAESISSDLKLVKPLASQLFNMKSEDLKRYMDEVESKLIEETDYVHELNGATEIGNACAHIPGLRFPQYYPEWSNKRVLTMDWIDGQMLPVFLKNDPPQEVRNRIGQAMWDFFLFQVKTLRKVHADPHPGNFIIDKDHKLCVIDFGCVKVIPDDFFDSYFQLLKPEVLQNEELLDNLYEQLDMLKPEDTPREKALLKTLYHEMITLLGLPFQTETFDFANEDYFSQLFGLGEKISKDKELRKMNNARGSKHGIYVLRTFFGLYSLLHQLKANVRLNYTLD
jgi:predicted unusual protein kinase regulating ubiquinone biosynthesis (AarF/ABC1/UbiB family)